MDKLALLLLIAVISPAISDEPRRKEENISRNDEGAKGVKSGKFLRPLSRTATAAVEAPFPYATNTAAAYNAPQSKQFSPSGYYPHSNPYYPSVNPQYFNSQVPYYPSPGHYSYPHAYNPYRQYTPYYYNPYGNAHSAFAPGYLVANEGNSPASNPWANYWPSFGGNWPPSAFGGYPAPASPEPQPAPGSGVAEGSAPEAAGDDSKKPERLESFEVTAEDGKSAPDDAVDAKRLRPASPFTPEQQYLLLGQPQYYGAYPPPPNFPALGDPIAIEGASRGKISTFLFYYPPQAQNPLDARNPSPQQNEVESNNVASSAYRRFFLSQGKESREKLTENAASPTATAAAAGSKQSEKQAGDKPQEKISEADRGGVGENPSDSVKNGSLNAKFGEKPILGQNAAYVAVVSGVTSELPVVKTPVAKYSPYKGYYVEKK